MTAPDQIGNAASKNFLQGAGRPHMVSGPGRVGPQDLPSRTASEKLMQARSKSLLVPALTIACDVSCRSHGGPDAGSNEFIAQALD